MAVVQPLIEAGTKVLKQGPYVSGLVSIIIPAYNCAQYVSEAIFSVIHQDYPQKQIIVVNDGSKDNTLEILQSFGDTIELIDQANAGPPRARNSGLAAARGEYIAFLDADDVWAPGKLSAQVHHLKVHTEVGTVFTQWYVWNADSSGAFQIPLALKLPLTGVGIVPERSGWMYSKLLLECHLLTTTVMMRRSTIEQIGSFDCNLYNGDDYDFWLRASRVAKIDKLDCVGAYYRVISGSVSRRARPKNDEKTVVEMALKRWGLEGPGNDHQYPEVIQQHLDKLTIQFAYTHLQWGDAAVAKSGYLEVLGRKPWRVALWFGFLAALWKQAKT